MAAGAPTGVLLPLCGGGRLYVHQRHLLLSPLALVGAAALWALLPPPRRDSEAGAAALAVAGLPPADSGGGFADAAVSKGWYPGPLAAGGGGSAAQGSEGGDAGGAGDSGVLPPLAGPDGPPRRNWTEAECRRWRAQGFAAVATHGLPPRDKLRDHYDSAMLAAERYRGCHRAEKGRQGNKELGKRSRRRVWADLGSRQLDVTSNFERLYPGASQFDMYAFEPNSGLAGVYERKPGVRWIRAAVDIVNGTAVLSDHDVGSTVVRRVQERQGQAMKGAREVTTINWVDWLVRTVTPEDFVVVKMDVEFCEFALLHLLLRSFAITLVDELLLECHFRTRRSRKFVTTAPGEERPISREECKNLVHALELSGIWAVNWAKKNFWADYYARRHGGFQAT
eukprot:TRINITY_DN35370_c0_g1_i1.p1 TRINITY_DN35370_c0_g1~~TRINITY_DN35370_c0_g1_i1.p1  ORF type:complete len:419 (+),score=89.62 TRINITY_DN35370_c0_g1_i1:75-1259(+)